MPADEVDVKQESECKVPSEGRRGSLMDIGRRVDYAVRALSYLAAQDDGRVVPSAEIERHQGVPPHFLSKILRRLVAAGLLRSTPGARGGFRLALPADEITFRAAYEAVEGRLSLIECVKRNEDFCGFTSICLQRNVWIGAQKTLVEYLEGVTIAQIADPAGLVPRSERAPAARASRKRSGPRKKASTRRSRMR